MLPLNRAEFEMSAKVNYWNGRCFNASVVTRVTLNPIDNIVEYKLFYREGGSTAKRSRVFVTTTPMFIKESVHFKDPAEAKKAALQKVKDFKMPDDSVL